MGFWMGSIPNTILNLHDFILVIFGLVKFYY